MPRCWRFSQEAQGEGRKKAADTVQERRGEIAVEKNFIMIIVRKRKGRREEMRERGKGAGKGREKTLADEPDAKSLSPGRETTLQRKGSPETGNERDTHFGNEVQPNRHHQLQHQGI